MQSEGILLLDKPKGKTSFWLVQQVRRTLRVQKVGHAGTLDPFASGVMVLLVGRNYTRLSNRFLSQDKEYLCQLKLGERSTTGDPEGLISPVQASAPTQSQVATVLERFQGSLEQIPPMYSAKKVRGQKLYHLARQGIVIERRPIQVTLDIRLISYAYPTLEIAVVSSKGAYMRTLAEDIGTALGTGAYLCALQRVRSGPFTLAECMDGERLLDGGEGVAKHLRTHICAS